MSTELIKRYSSAVPRYTSYPTANHFSPKIGRDQYSAWLAALSDDAVLSAYVHIPYCHELCWYCGCNTKAAQRYEPVSTYLTSLYQEIRSVGARLPVTARVSHIHWGGGSPSILDPADIRRLDEIMRAALPIADNVDYAIEVDPRNLDQDKIAAFAEIGVNRVSIGVQDFDPAVQNAINRQQSFELTRSVVDQFRAAGVPSINIDLVYGLPHQTRQSVTNTIRQVLELRPDRIAIFGYAHIPARIRHQRLIDEKVLPDAVERFGQSRRLARILTAAGYKQIGIDHFALPSDDLGRREIKRNFQGYTTDAAQALIGFGASAIGQFPQGYVQNAVAVHDYAERVARDGYATVRGIALSDDDRMRGAVIEKLMCNFEFSAADLKRNFGLAAEVIAAQAQDLVEMDQDGIVSATADGFKVTERGRPFVRAICACFDAYLGQGTAQHAMAV